MPRRRNRGSRAYGEQVSETVSGQFVVLHVTQVSGSSQLLYALNLANFGARVALQSDMYRLFRFVSVEATFSLGIVTSTPTGGGFIAYSPGSITAPTGFAETSTMEHFKMFFQNATVPVTLKLNRAQLAGISPWYQTEVSAAEPLLDTQGIFVIGNHFNGGAIASNLEILWKFTIEFSERLPTGVSLDRLRLSTGVDSSKFACLAVEEPDLERQVEEEKSFVQLGPSGGSTPKLLLKRKG